MGTAHQRQVGGDELESLFVIHEVLQVGRRGVADKSHRLGVEVSRRQLRTGRATHVLARAGQVDRRRNRDSAACRRGDYRELLQVAIRLLGFRVAGIHASDGKHRADSRGCNQRVHVDGSAAVSHQRSGISRAGHVGAVGVSIHALIFVVISPGSAANHAFAVLFADLRGILEQTLQAVDHAAHRQGIHHHEAISVLRGKALVKFGASRTDSGQISRRRAGSAYAVVNALGGVGDKIALDAGNQRRNSRGDVAVREVSDGVRSDQGQFGAVKTHVHMVLRRQRDGLAGLCLVLDIHYSATLRPGVLVRVSNAKLVSRFPAAFGLERLVILTVNGADEAGLFVRNLERLAGEQVWNIEGVSHGVTSFAVSRR